MPEVTPTLYCLHPDAHFVESLTRSHTNNCYQWHHFDTIASLIAAIEERYPFAILIETSFLPACTPIREKLSNIQNYNNTCVDLIFIDSTENLLNHRDAIRLDAAAYITGNSPHELLPKIQAHLSRESLLKKILIIAHDKEQTEFTNTTLTEAKYQCEICTTPSSAIQRLRQSSPNLILIDEGLVDITGIELARIIRSYDEFNHIAIVLRQKKSDHVSRNTALQHGIDDIIPKPTNSTHLLSIIEGRTKHSVIKHFTSPFQDIKKSNKTAEHQEASSQFKQLLNSGELSLSFQPMVNLHQREQATYELTIKHSRLNHHQDFDLWLVEQAVTVLQKHQKTDDVQVFVTTYAKATLNELLLTKLNEICEEYGESAIKGVIICFDLSTIAADIRNATNITSSLQALGVKVAISGFVNKSAAFNLIKYCHANYIVLANKLLNVSTKEVESVARKCQLLASEVIVRDINHVTTVNPTWFKHAHYAQGALIEQPLPTMNFDFSKTML